MVRSEMISLTDSRVSGSSDGLKICALLRTKPNRREMSEQGMNSKTRWLRVIKTPCFYNTISTFSSCRDRTKLVLCTQFQALTMAITPLCSNSKHALSPPCRHSTKPIVSHPRLRSVHHPTSSLRSTQAHQEVCLSTRDQASNQAWWAIWVQIWHHTSLSTMASQAYPVECTPTWIVRRV